MNMSFSFMLFNEIWRFLSEIKTDNFTVSNNENTTFGFSLFWITCFLYFINLRLNVLPYGFNVVYLSEITATTLKFRDQTSDVTYCADVTCCMDVTLFLHTTSGGRYFFCADFLRFIALNAIWANCLGAKLRYHQILYPLNTLNKTKLTRNG